MSLMVGCASPGPARPPPLQLPRPVSDLAATRRGDVVTLQFTLPTHSTDHTLLRPQALRGVLCRQERTLAAGSAAAPCVTIAGLTEALAAAASTQPHGQPSTEARPVTLDDALPPELTRGPERLLAYRVEFFGPLGSSAGASAPALTVAGPAPAPIVALQAVGSRAGIVLRWQDAPAAAQDTVVLARESEAGAAVKSPLAPKRRGPRAATANPDRQLDANPGASRSKVDLLQAHVRSAEGLSATLDASAAVGQAYRYRAWRQRTVHLHGADIVLESAPSASVAITLAAIYAPAAPTDLRAAGFLSEPATAASSTAARTFTVSLIWQPATDGGSPEATIAGYRVYRQPLDAQGQVTGERQRLDTAPVLLPSFDDTTADPTRGYRYEVTAVDRSGNESAPVGVALLPQQ